MKKFLSMILMAFSLNSFAETNLAGISLKDLNNHFISKCGLLGAQLVWQD